MPTNQALLGTNEKDMLISSTEWRFEKAGKDLQRTGRKDSQLVKRGIDRQH